MGKSLVSHEVINLKYFKALFSEAFKIRTVMKNLLTAMKQVLAQPSLELQFHFKPQIS